jgi:hypothetical protein
MYVVDPTLFATALAKHSSAGLWLPVPLVISDESVRTRVLLPVEALVRDRATLLGLQIPVQDLYRRLTAALTAAGFTQDQDYSRSQLPGIAGT